MFDPHKAIAQGMASWFGHPFFKTGHADFGIGTTMVLGREVGVQGRVLWQSPFCELFHFETDTTVARPRVLLVAPMSGHFSTLLTATVKTLLPDHDVFITNWRSARDVALSDGPFGMDEQIDEIVRCIRSLGPDVHIIAFSQSTVTALLAIALLAMAGDLEQPKSMTLIAGPIDTSRSPTEVNAFATSHPLSWFAQLLDQVPHGYRGEGRAIYPGSLQLAMFTSMNMQHVHAHVQLLGDLIWGNHARAEATRAFYREYHNVMDLSAAFFLETLERVFQENQIARRLYCHRGELVVLGAIGRTALFVVEGKDDDVCGEGQTMEALGLLVGLPSDMKGYLLATGGHIGIICRQEWEEQVLPKVAAFIGRHDRAVPTSSRQS